ncbi:hypothetical protein D1872_324560 [compost metagenome]
MLFADKVGIVEVEGEVQNRVDIGIDETFGFEIVELQRDKKHVVTLLVFTCQGTT